MSFSPEAKTRMLVRCARICCLCRKACGTNIEAAHIVPEGEGGSNDEENGIPLCFDCHQEVGAYSNQHPKGNKFRPEELRTRRDQVYALVESGQIPVSATESQNDTIRVVNSPGAIVTNNQTGDNIVYNVSPNFSRQLTDGLKQEVISALNSLRISNVSIRYEHSAETREFVEVLERFLEGNGFKVYPNAVSQSEIPRTEFTIRRHPTDPAFARITIGTLL